MVRPAALKLALVLALLLVVGSSTSARAEFRSTHEFELTLAKDGDLQVTETIRLSGDYSSAPLTRSFWLKGAQGAWPLQQRIDKISVRDSEGKSLRFRWRKYETRANIDLVELPKSGVLVMRYLVHRPLIVSKSQVNWQWNVTGYDWRGTVSEVRIRLVHPDAPTPIDSKFQYLLGYSNDQALHVDSSADGSALLWAFSPEAPPDTPIQISLDVIRGSVGPVPAEWYWIDFAKLTRVPLIALVLLFVLGVVLMISRPKDVIAATSVANAIPGVAAMVSAFGLSSYWYFENTQRAAGNDFSGEFIVNIGLAGFLLLFAWKQRKTLAQRQRAAYFTQFAFPSVLLVAWPLAFVDYGMVIFPLLSFPLYFYWPRRKIALEFGVGAHRISEEVGGRAQVSVADLASHFKITRTALLHALKLNPHLPVVVDHAHQMVLSAEAAAMRKELCVCTYCGGATEVAGMGVQKCGYCSRQFTSNKKRRSEKPLPLVIETLAIFFETMATGGYFFAGTIALAALVMETVDGSIVAGVVGGVIAGGIFCIPALLVSKLASQLRKGQGIGGATFLLLLTAWLIAPLVVLMKLRSKRVQFFTGAMSTKELGAELKTRGEWSLKEFADYLQTNQEDAAELAQYLAVNQIVDAVYDRREARLVDQALYRAMAKEGSCTRCGGFFGVQSGRATCHFCGDSPRAASTHS